MYSILFFIYTTVFISGAPGAKKDVSVFSVTVWSVFEGMFARCLGCIKSGGTGVKEKIVLRSFGLKGAVFGTAGAILANYLLGVQ